jgi:hypothetical protein
VLVNGADVSLDLAKLESDFRSGAWNGVGQDFGELATWLTATSCKSFVCHLAEGILEGAEIAFDHLEGCEADLQKAESLFVAGATYWSGKHYANAVKVRRAMRRARRRVSSASADGCAWPRSPDALLALLSAVHARAAPA